MAPAELILLLVLCTSSIAILARRLDQPYPLALLLGGIVLAYIPGAPQVELNPQFVFFLFLPPILSEAAYFTSWRDFWRLKRPILLLAFGLVTATSIAVAGVCVYAIAGMKWATGLVLGAIVSPPDAAAATSITRGLRLPRRIVHILEGESLVNDASALVLYQFAVAAVVTGGFSLGSAFGSLAWNIIAGVGVGALLGFLLVKAFPYIRDGEVEILLTFLLSYGTYFVAEEIHASGVLATVASGMILGRYSPELLSAGTRVRAQTVWQLAIFLINGVVFLLIGLQVRRSIEQLAGYPPDLLAGWALLIVITVMVVRLLWVLPLAYLPRLLSRRIRATEPSPPLAQVFVVGWTGLRGVVSLAAALALPEETASGFPLPYRSLIILLTVAVILGTLLLQGSTLRPLVRLLRINVDRSSEQEELVARVEAGEKVLTRLLQMTEQDEAPADVLSRVRGYYEDKMTEWRAQLEAEGISSSAEPGEFRSLAEQRVWFETIRIQRNTIVVMRNEEKIGDEALRGIQRDVDLLEMRLTPQSGA